MSILNIENIRMVLRGLELSNGIASLNVDDTIINEETEDSIICLAYCDKHHNICNLYYTIDGDLLSHPILWSVDFKDKDDVNLVSEIILQGNEIDGIYSNVHIEGGPDIFRFNGYDIDMTQEEITFKKIEEK